MYTCTCINSFSAWSLVKYVRTYVCTYKCTAPTSTGIQGSYPDQ